MGEIIGSQRNHEASGDTSNCICFAVTRAAFIRPEKLLSVIHRPIKHDGSGFLGALAHGFDQGRATIWGGINLHLRTRSEDNGGH